MKFSFFVLIVGATLLVVSNASAQFPGGRPPHGGMGGPPPGWGHRPPGGPGGPGFPGPGFRPGPPPASLATVPVAALANQLKLTASQRAKIAQYQKSFRQQRPPPRPGQMPFGGDKMRRLNQQVSQKIEGTLTAAQKQSVPGLLHEMDALQSAGIPLEIYTDLKLTASQKKKLMALAPPRGRMGGPPRDGMGGPPPGGPGDRPPFRPGMMQGGNPKAMTILTAGQKAMVEKYHREHPRMGPGGNFGPPPPPPGDFGRP